MDFDRGFQTFDRGRRATKRLPEHPEINFEASEMAVELPTIAAEPSETISGCWNAASGYSNVIFESWDNTPERWDTGCERPDIIRELLTASCVLRLASCVLNNIGTSNIKKDV